MTVHEAGEDIALVFGTTARGSTPPLPGRKVTSGWR